MGQQSTEPPDLSDFLQRLILQFLPISLYVNRESILLCRYRTADYQTDAEIQVLYEISFLTD